MKKLSIFTLALLTVSALMLTSCLGSNDGDSYITPEEQHSAFLAASGSYTGDCIFMKAGSATEKDSADVSWSLVTDSTLTIQNFPLKPLAENVSNTELKEAMEKLSDTTLDCYIGFYQSNPPTLLINPKPIDLNLSYAGADHKVRIYFYVNNYYSAGVYDAETHTLTMTLIEAAVYVDDSQTNMLDGDKAFQLVGKKI